MRWFAAVLVCALVGLAAAKPTYKKKTPVHPLALDWKLERKGNALALRYTITNTSAKPVVVLDRLFHPTAKGKEPAFDRVIVRPGDSPDIVSFVRGYVAPTTPIGGVHPPVARTIEPKQSVTGEATIPLPLAGWHNFAPSQTLAGTPTKAVLEIGYLVGHTKWVKLTLTDGTELVGPGHPFVTEQKLIRSDVKPLP